MLQRASHSSAAVRHDITFLVLTRGALLAGPAVQVCGSLYIAWTLSDCFPEPFSQSLLQQDLLRGRFPPRQLIPSPLSGVRLPMRPDQRASHNLSFSENITYMIFFNSYCLERCWVLVGVSKIFFKPKPTDNM